MHQKPQLSTKSQRPSDQQFRTPSHFPHLSRGAAIAVIVSTVFVLLFAAATGFHYRSVIRGEFDSVVFMSWLFITMVAGMMARLISTQCRSSKPQAKITGIQLALPLMFSLVVFYPIWTMATAEEHTFFSFYSAFLNGFFWESVVSNAQFPKEPKPKID